MCQLLGKICLTSLAPADSCLLDYSMIAKRLPRCSKNLGRSTKKIPNEISAVGSAALTRSIRFACALSLVPKRSKEQRRSSVWRPLLVAVLFQLLDICDWRATLSSPKHHQELSSLSGKSFTLNMLSWASFATYKLHCLRLRSRVLWAILAFDLTTHSALTTYLGSLLMSTLLWLLLTTSVSISLLLCIQKSGSECILDMPCFER